VTSLTTDNGKIGTMCKVCAAFPRQSALCELERRSTVVLSYSPAAVRARAVLLRCAPVRHGRVSLSRDGNVRPTIPRIRAVKNRNNVAATPSSRFRFVRPDWFFKITINKLAAPDVDPKSPNLSGRAAGLIMNPPGSRYQNRRPDDDVRCTIADQ